LEEFIIGQIIVVCKGARSGARPCFFYKVIHRLIHRLCRGVGVIHRLWKTDAGVLNLTAYTYILPRKKYTLK
jgi:hypothetical protein